MARAVPKLFLVPTRILSGAGSLSAAGAEAARLGRRALVVIGRGSVRRSGALDRCLASLSESGVAAEVFDGCEPEPSLATVNEVVAAAGRHRADVIVGLGGGSVVDAAKAAAAVPAGESVTPYFRGEKDLSGPGIPVIAIPTTSGTGSEVTPNAVLTDTERSVKASLRAGEWMFPKAAILDPELVISCPPETTASAGMDALCQAIEAYVSVGAGPFSDALALDAAEAIAGNLVRAFERPGDVAARSAVHYGATMAGMAFASSRLGAVHGIAHPLGARYGVPHGIACAVLLPHVMRINMEAAAAKYAALAKRLSWVPAGSADGDAAERAVDRVLEMMRKLGIEPSLRAWRVPESDFENIAEQSLPSGSMKHNPRQLSRGEIITLLRQACS